MNIHHKIIKKVKGPNKSQGIFQFVKEMISIFIMKKKNRNDFKFYYEDL